MYHINPVGWVYFLYVLKEKKNEREINIFKVMYLINGRYGWNSNPGYLFPKYMLFSLYSHTNPLNIFLRSRRDYKRQTIPLWVRWFCRWVRCKPSLFCFLATLAAQPTLYMLISSGKWCNFLDIHYNHVQFCIWKSSYQKRKRKKEKICMCKTEKNFYGEN